MNFGLSMKHMWITILYVIIRQTYNSTQENIVFEIHKRRHQPILLSNHFLTCTSKLLSESHLNLKLVGSHFLLFDMSLTVKRVITGNGGIFYVQHRRFFNFLASCTFDDVVVIRLRSSAKI